MGDPIMRVEIDHPDGGGRCLVPPEDPRARDASLNPGEPFDAAAGDAKATKAPAEPAAPSGDKASAKKATKKAEPAGGDGGPTKGR